MWWNIRTADLNLYIIQKIRCAGHLIEPQQMPKKTLGGNPGISRPLHSISTHLTREMQSCYLPHRFAGLSMFQQSCRIHSPWNFCCSSLIKFWFNQLLFKISLLLQVLFQSTSLQTFAAPPSSVSISLSSSSGSSSLIKFCFSSHSFSLLLFSMQKANVYPLKIVILFKTLMPKP